MSRLIYSKRTDAKVPPLTPPKPVRMSYSNYAYLKGLLDIAEGRIKHDYQVALTFISPEKNRSRRQSSIDKAHQILCDELANINLVREELHAAVKAAYRDHPDPEMRRFWGIEIEN